MRDWCKSSEGSSSLSEHIEYGYGMGDAVNFEVAHVFERLFMGGKCDPCLVKRDRQNATWLELFDRALVVRTLTILKTIGDA